MVYVSFVDSKVGMTVLMLFTAIGNWNLTETTILSFTTICRVSEWVSEWYSKDTFWVEYHFKVRMMFQCSVFPCLFAKMFDLGVICPPSIVLVASVCCCSDRQLCIFWQALIVSMVFFHERHLCFVFFSIKRSYIIFLDFTDNQSSCTVLSQWSLKLLLLPFMYLTVDGHPSFTRCWKKHLKNFK